MTRDEILEAAATIFSQKGYHAASMQDIAQAVNLQKASLYHHVSSKQEILVDLLDRALDLLAERLEEVLQQPVSADEKLRQAIASYLLALSENHDLASVLFLEHRSLDPSLHHRHIPRRDRFENLWRRMIQEGVEAGCFECEDIPTMVRALLGAMNWTVTWYRPSGMLGAQTIAGQFATLFLLGLEKRSGKGE